jgi:hypothetical protein
MDARVTAGDAAVDDLFERVASEERLVSPWLDSPSTTGTIVDVAAPAGATEIEPPRSLGLFDTVVMLDAWLPWTQTRQAINGWSGSGYTSYTRADGAVCFAAAVSFDADPTPFAEAVAAWAAAAGSAATPAITGSTVSFEACSRGDGAPLAPEPFFSPLDAMLVEYDAVMSGGAAATPDVVEAALCYAGRTVDDPAVVAQLSGDQITVEQQAALDYLTHANSEICGYIANSEAG